MSVDIFDVDRVRIVSLSRFGKKVEKSIITCLYLSFDVKKRDILQNVTNRIVVAGRPMSIQ